MRIIILIFIIFLASCNNKKENFYQCAKNARLFSRENTYPIRFDTNNTFRDIKKLSNQIRDTLEDLFPFGFIYNYADSSFIPNANSMYNLVIEGILIIPKNSHVSLGGPYLILFITQDSIEIFNEIKNTHMIFHKNDARVRESFNDYYNTAYCIADNIWEPKYTHIVIPDSLDFNEYLLPYFRILMSSYKQSIEKYTAMNNSSICDSSKYRYDNFKARGAIEFTVLVNDFDHEKKKVK